MVHFIFRKRRNINDLKGFSKVEEGKGTKKEKIFDAIKRKGLLRILRISTSRSRPEAVGDNSGIRDLPINRTP